MLDNFESISPTAIVTAYPRQFTDIPYEKEIYQWLQKNCKDNDVKLNKTILIDDIYTTGSTLDAVALELKRHGVGAVYFIALCIGEGM